MPTRWLYDHAALTIGLLAVSRLVMFGLALVAHLRWKVPVRDLVQLLRASRLVPEKRPAKRRR